MLAVQAALDQVGPGVIGFFPRTLDDHLAIDMLPTRASAAPRPCSAALALVLSAAGLYGIVMWFVEVRRREIGVRVALGASAGDVRRLVVRQAAMAAAPGLVIGLLMAIALTAVRAIVVRRHRRGRSHVVAAGDRDVECDCAGGELSTEPTRHAGRPGDRVAGLLNCRTPSVRCFNRLKDPLPKCRVT